MAIAQERRTCKPAGPPDTGAEAARPAALSVTEPAPLPAPDPRFARGAVIGLMLVAPFWCLLALALWWLFG